MLDIARRCMPDDPIVRFKDQKTNNGHRNYEKHLPDYMIHIHHPPVQVETEKIAEKIGKKDDAQVKCKHNPSRKVAAGEICVKFMIHILENQNKNY